ncbi:hypothetical protein NG800_011935 [Epilithonimonas ginsengisoli]|uniref:Uncharacterized protein n=1 Tax=Epilithonimonas ginsengisoli TaxID=1245592 RepID=A0ABU4JJ40_9FLAO|nr:MULTISPECIES: hypothetical protein [Chryseobacterium group]MBV6880806.1 hypothetical protein [Epilithonimonas sp. FP105]MDW8549624.1 hypothetical protein [Epilithonimonas ginsengisoli]OAH76753.1 hypothetical protein AXA65_00265 [Chryseobacterium sp. FP211-J200]
MKTSQTEKIFDYLMVEFRIDKTQIVNFWDADDCAFGITNVDKTILIYISTFNKEVDEYYLEIECQNQENQILENINLECLVNTIKPILCA